MVPKVITPKLKESRMNIFTDVLKNTDNDPELLDRVNFL